jgi:hypothetical protein
MHKPCVITFPSNRIKPIDEISTIDEITDDITEEERMEIESIVREDQDNIMEIDTFVREDPANILKFTDTKKQFPVPFALYIDFESFITEDAHEPSGFGCLRVSSFEEYNQKKSTSTAARV